MGRNWKQSADYGLNRKNSKGERDKQTIKYFGVAAKVKKESENKGSRGKNANQQHDSSKPTPFDASDQSKFLVYLQAFLYKISFIVPPTLRVGETNMPWTKTRVKRNNTKKTCRK